MHWQRGVDHIHMEERARRYAMIFLIAALPTLIALCFITAPFGSPDEPAHLLRAASIAEGHMAPIAQRDPLPRRHSNPSAGGYVDSGLAQLAAATDWEKTWESGARPSRRMMADQARIEASGRSDYAAFSNTAIYPPILYTASAAACRIARALGLPVLACLYLGRLANALFCALLGWLAIRRGGVAAPLLLVCAPLPTVLFETASVSADALLFGAFLLFAALTSRIAFQAPTGRRDLILLGCATIVAGAGKVAYLPLVALPPLMAYIVDRRLSDRVVWLGVCGLCAVALWAAWAAATYGKIFSLRIGIDVDPRRQIAFMWDHPGISAALVFKTAILPFFQLTRQGVGRAMGWHDIQAPSVIVDAALLMIAGTGLLGATSARPKAISRRQRSSSRSPAIWLSSCCSTSSSTRWDRLTWSAFRDATSSLSRSPSSRSRPAGDRSRGAGCSMPISSCPSGRHSAASRPCGRSSRAIGSELERARHTSSEAGPHEDQTQLDLRRNGAGSRNRRDHGMPADAARVSRQLSQHRIPKR